MTVMAIVLWLMFMLSAVLWWRCLALRDENAVLKMRISAEREMRSGELGMWRMRARAAEAAHTTFCTEVRLARLRASADQSADYERAAAAALED